MLEGSGIELKFVFEGGVQEKFEANLKVTFDSVPINTALAVCESYRYDLEICFVYMYLLYGEF